MKVGIIATLIFASMQSIRALQEVRNAYFRSSISQADALTFEHLMDSVGENAAPVLVCYKGAAEMLRAKNAVNPISKFFFFKRGKILIEQGVMRDTTCVECHFVRFSIQHNLPGFLAYNQNISVDSVMVAKALQGMSDNDLKVKITRYYQQLKINRKSE
ncbi:MAG: hypothetical protein JST19_14835 [Bacteroidetes bacterium]|nr:hypothetical protein [Bacteroidota bacterium]